MKNHPRNPLFFLLSFRKIVQRNPCVRHRSSVPDPGLRQVAGGDHTDGALGTSDFALLAYLCRSGVVGDLFGAQKTKQNDAVSPGKNMRL